MFYKLKVTQQLTSPNPSAHATRAPPKKPKKEKVTTLMSVVVSQTPAAIKGKCY